MNKVTLSVRGMTCMGCVASVRKVLEAIPGVAEVDISLDKGEVIVAYDGAKTGQAQLIQAINDAGYEVIE